MVTGAAAARPQSAPILLFNGECAVCRRIAQWVRTSAGSDAGIVERPIGDNPDALRLLNPALDIWDAYATVHVLMPDGSMKVGGEAVAEVLRSLPNTKYAAGILDVEILGARPFQATLNLAYAVLSEVRPLLGCESCGTPNPFVRTAARAIARVSSLFGDAHRPPSKPHLKSATRRKPRSSNP